VIVLKSEGLAATEWVWFKVTNGPGISELGREAEIV